VREDRKPRARKRPRRIRRFSAAHVVWSGILRILQRVVHHKKSDRREFKLAFSVRDLLAEKSKAVKAQFEALVQAVQKAGKYPAKEEAARAVHAVMDALKDKLPPDVLSRVAESLQTRLHPENGKNDTNKGTAEGTAAGQAKADADGPVSAEAKPAGPTAGEERPTA
jgi:hypothetical protein